MKTFIISLVTAVVAVIIGAFFTPDIIDWKEGKLHIKVKKSLNMKIPNGELYRTKFVLTNSTKKRILKKDFKDKPCVKFLHQKIVLLDLNTIEKNDNHLSIIPMDNYFCFDELDIKINTKVNFYIYSTNKIKISNIYLDAVIKENKFSLLESIYELDDINYKNIAIFLLVIIILFLFFVIIIQNRKVKNKVKELSSSLIIIDKKDSTLKSLKSNFERIKESARAEISTNKRKINEMDSELSIYREISKNDSGVKNMYNEYKKKVDEIKKLMKKVRS